MLEAKLSTKAGDLTIYRLAALREKGIGNVERLPFSIKVIIESALGEAASRSPGARDAHPPFTSRGFLH